MFKASSSTVAELKAQVEKLKGESDRLRAEAARAKSELAALSAKAKAKVAEKEEATAAARQLAERADKAEAMAEAHVLTIHSLQEECSRRKAREEQLLAHAEQASADEAAARCALLLMADEIKGAEADLGAEAAAHRCAVEEVERAINAADGAAAREEMLGAEVAAMEAAAKEAAATAAAAATATDLQRRTLCVELFQLEKDRHHAIAAASSAEAEEAARSKELRLLMEAFTSAESRHAAAMDDLAASHEEKMQLELGEMRSMSEQLEASNQALTEEAQASRAKYEQVAAKAGALEERATWLQTELERAETDKADAMRQLDETVRVCADAGGCVHARALLAPPRVRQREGARVGAREPMLTLA
eukprot:6192083-Pleurochrysis_carterae.AAC.2